MEHAGSLESTKEAGGIVHQIRRRKKRTTISEVIVHGK